MKFDEIMPAPREPMDNIIFTLPKRLKKEIIARAKERNLTMREWVIMACIKEIHLEDSYN
jgi:hypothetical protein